VCTFITLIAASDDLDRVNAVLSTLNRRDYQRRAVRVDTPAVRRVLAAEEREYFLVHGPCDCGTFLGHALGGDADPDAKRAADIERYRRKGWSDARIARAIGEKHRADARPSRHKPNEDAAYWIDLMMALATELGLKRLGLMNHFYKTGPGNEPDYVSRKEAGPIAHSAETLASMAGSVIHDFTQG
jgi:hypothetical protein